MGLLCRELTRALLKHDFGINWSLKERQLIPAVTNRVNYIHWLEDLLALAPTSGLPVCHLIHDLVSSACSPFKTESPSRRALLKYAEWGWGRADEKRLHRIKIGRTTSKAEILKRDHLDEMIFPASSCHSLLSGWMDDERMWEGMNERIIRCI